MNELFVKLTLFRWLFYVSLEQVFTVNFSAWPCWTTEIQEIAQSLCLMELTVNTVGVKTVIYY